MLVSERIEQDKFANMEIIEDSPSLWGSYHISSNSKIAKVVYNNLNKSLILIGMVGMLCGSLKCLLE